MGIARELIKGVYAYCQNPGQDELKLEDVLAVMNDVQASLNNDLQLSPQNRLVQVKDLSADAKQISLASIPDFNEAMRVERQIDAVNDYWEDVPMIDLADLNDAEAKNRLVCARYGTPPKLAFSWDPSVSGDVIRMWYEPVPPDLTTLSDSPTVCAAYHPLIKLRTAKICREVLMGLPASGALDAELSKHQQQFDQWRRRSPNQTVVQRVAYNEDRSSGRRGWFW